MKPLDGRTLDDGQTFDTDICIVGAGAAGITLASALAERRIDVLLVEGGDVSPDAAAQALHDVDSVGYPLRPNYINRARHYGGTCNLWAGRCMPLWPEDFAGRPWVPGSAWPISAREVTGHYPEAGRILGIPAAALLSPGAWTGQLTATEAGVYSGGELVPTVSLWGKRPMRFADVHGSGLAMQDRARILLNAQAMRLDCDPARRTVGALQLATLTGRRFTVRAQRYVLAAGGMENARLLLLSGGLGNDHGHVGRYFMEHPRAVFGKAVLEPGSLLRLMRGWPLRDGKVQLGMALSPDAQSRDQLLNHYCTFESEASQYAAAAYEAAVDVGKVLLRRGHAGGRLDFGNVGKSGLEGFIYQLSPKEIMPHWLFRLGMSVKARLRPPRGPQRFIIVTFCEQPPSADSRVYLGNDVDALGLPRLVVDWRIGDDVRRSLFRLHEVIGDVLARRGLGWIEPGDPDELHFTDASHHMGTTRMSREPTAGVVDTDGRVHGLSNLWVAGSSVFPSAGHANPTLTIVALALRLAAHLGGDPSRAGAGGL
jgi:choline dehydrogenase-like flavoprotein